jgi:2-polyprenyl-3-methyl-5-hydroxy-6-metoxy-1,4-benzoquinol methylase
MISNARQLAIDTGWLRPAERLLAERLAFPLKRDLPDVVHEFNLAARDRVLRDMLTGAARPVAIPSCLDPGSEDITVAEVERYGLPLRTVLSAHSGLMRSDPYYDSAYLAIFYRDFYRHLYRPRRFSLAWFLSEQIRNGQRIRERVGSHLRPSGRVLDIGCGMGGMLIPFTFEDCTVVGIDYGADYAAHGQRLGLDVRIGGFEKISAEKPFDLIMMSHVLEHVADPVDFLRRAAGHLAPGGVCYIEVPGILNIRKVYDGDVLTYFQNAHQWHFCSQTLKAVMARAGLYALSADENITCIAQAGTAQPAAASHEGPRVRQEILELERHYAAADRPVVPA